MPFFIMQFLDTYLYLVQYQYVWISIPQISSFIVYNYKQIFMSVTSEKLEQIYKVYDQKRNNRIPTTQIAKLIRSARLFPSEQDIESLKKAVDPNKQGTFSMKKFVQVGLDFASKQSQINHEEQLLKAFAFFDEDQNGYITQSDLKKIMSAFGQPLNEQQTKQILKYAKTVNGKIYYKEFARTIISGKLD